MSLDSNCGYFLGKGMKMGTFKIVSICRDCRSIRLFRTSDRSIFEEVCECKQSLYSLGQWKNIYVTSGTPISTSGIYNVYLSDPRQCEFCTIDNNCFLCEVNDHTCEEFGFMSKCKKCEYKYLCGTSRLEPINYKLLEGEINEERLSSRSKTKAGRVGQALYEIGKTCLGKK
jgi:hypothetical protein